MRCRNGDRVDALKHLGGRFDVGEEGGVYGGDYPSVGDRVAR